MIKIALRRPDNIAYIIDELGTHAICVGFSGDEQTYRCRQKFPLDAAERAALGSLGERGELARDPEQAARQQEEVLDMAYCKGREAGRKGKDAKPDAGTSAKASVNLAELAGRILAATAESPKWDKGSLRRPWYMMNVSHPVVDKLLDRFRMKNGISRGLPLSDEQRLVFELSLLRPGVLKEVAAAVVMAEEDNRHFRDTG